MCFQTKQLPPDGFQVGYVFQRPNFYLADL